VEWVIGYPVNHVLERAAAADIRPIIVRQERTGLHMAEAISRVTSGRKLGVFAMQHGPGTENAYAKLTSEDAPLSPYRVLWDLQKTVDIANTIITHDAGSPRDQLSPFWRSTHPLAYIGWGKTTQLGSGLGYAMGAKLARHREARRRRAGHQARHRRHRKGVDERRTASLCRGPPRASLRARLFAKDLFHRLALGEFVDEFVEVADLAHHRLLNLLHADAAYDAGDQRAGGVHLRRVREEILEARLLRKLGFQRGLAVAGEPAEDLVDLGPGAALLLRLGNIRGIDACNGHGIDAAPVGGGPGCLLHDSV
jgi:hypothetical protein